MARVRKFNEPGAKEDRIRWNKSGTRKWLTVYTVMEYHPEAKAKASGQLRNPGSIVGRNFVAQVALFLRFGGSHLFAQGFDLQHQQVDLLLLAKNGAIEFIDHVFGKADLDLKIGQA